MSPSEKSRVLIADDEPAADEAALANLLNIIGRRAGSRSVISLG